MSAKTIPVPKISIERLHVSSFWSKYFPNDPETYNLRMTVTGLILSFLAVAVIFDKFGDLRFFDSIGIFIVCGYIVLVAWVSYEFYNGLKIADPRRYTTWIIVKLFEFFFIIASCVYGIYDGALPIIYVFSVIVLMLDGFLTFVVIKLWRRQLNRQGTCSASIKRNMTHGIFMRV